MPSAPFHHRNGPNFEGTMTWYNSDETSHTQMDVHLARANGEAVERPDKDAEGITHKTSQ